jgi:hypothetical protein
MSRRHRANPLVSLKADKIFGCPGLFSGMGSLIINKAELGVLSHHVKNNNRKFAEASSEDS